MNLFKPKVKTFDPSKAYTGFPMIELNNKGIRMVISRARLAKAVEEKGFIDNVRPDLNCGNDQCFNFEHVDLVPQLGFMDWRYKFLYIWIHDGKEWGQYAEYVWEASASKKELDNFVEVKTNELKFKMMREGWGDCMIPEYFIQDFTDNKLTSDKLKHRSHVANGEILVEVNNENS